MAFIRSFRRFFTKDLHDTLRIRYGVPSDYEIKKKNPSLSYRYVSNDGHEGIIVSNGKRKLFVRTFDDKWADKGKTRAQIRRDKFGRYVMYVPSSCTRDYMGLTAEIDKALNVK